MSLITGGCVGIGVVVVVLFVATVVVLMVVVIIFGGSVILTVCEFSTGLDWAGYEPLLTEKIQY